eukprot:1524509-Prymnesium_polylepis.1
MGSRLRTVSEKDAASLPSDELSSTKPSEYAAETRQSSLNTTRGGGRRPSASAHRAPHSVENTNCIAVIDSGQCSGFAFRSTTLELATQRADVAYHSGMRMASHTRLREAGGGAMLRVAP